MLTNHWMCLSPRCWSWALKERMLQLVGWVQEGTQGPWEQRALCQGAGVAAMP